VSITSSLSAAMVVCSVKKGFEESSSLPLGANPREVRPDKVGGVEKACRSGKERPCCRKKPLPPARPGAHGGPRHE